MNQVYYGAFQSRLLTTFPFNSIESILSTVTELNNQRVLLNELCDSNLIVYFERPQLSLVNRLNPTYDHRYVI